MPEALARRFADIFQRPLLNCYGTVECSGITSIVPVAEDTRIATLGDFHDEVRLEVVRKDGTHISMDEVGEIRIAGPHVSRLTLPGQAPAASQREDEWFYTGDLATIGDNGAIILVTREADVIHKGGYPVYPGEVELVVASHPSVQDVALVGVSDDLCLEEVKGFVVLKPGQTMAESDLMAYCSRHLPVYKCPRHVQFVASLPRNYLGQVLRKDLRKLTQPAGSQRRY